MSNKKEIDLEELSVILGSDSIMPALKTIVDALQYIADVGNEYSEDSDDPIDSVNMIIGELRGIIPEMYGLADDWKKAWWDYEFAKCGIEKWRPHRDLPHIQCFQ